MFSTAASSKAVSFLAGPLSAQTAGMATLKEIQIRRRSVQNIGKITKSMKMIASTKVPKAQKIMESARVYGAASNGLFQHAQTDVAESKKPLVIAISSDRGLCGGIHSSISKATKADLRKNPESTVVVLGQKVKIQLSREYRDNIALHFEQVAKTIPTWDETAAIADIILEKAKEEGVDSAKIFYNKFKTIIAFETTSIPTFTLEALEASPKLSTYEYDEGVLANFTQFAFANTLYWAVAEGNASEMAAKRTAMENATKNAGEVIAKLTLTFNRTRQAAITNELIDIIVGASAM
ncbi:ATP synthase F1, gamma subunit [Cladochytrium replicatum]|nr:ATP synthase F1, gamma subunit [Cladochytrium replicatum]